VQAAAFKRLREAHSRGRMFHYNCLLQDLIAKISSQTNVYQFMSGLVEFQEKWLAKSNMTILDIINLSSQFAKDGYLTAKFFGFLKKILELEGTEGPQ
jgi:hypothetical protein